MENVEMLLNDKFKVLSCLYENRDSENIVKLTQNEIAEKVECSRPTIGLILKELKRIELVKDTSFVGRYEITEKGIKAVRQIRGEK